MRAYRGQAPVRPETRQTGVTAFVRVTPVCFWGYCFFWKVPLACLVMRPLACQRARSMRIAEGVTFFFFAFRSLALKMGASSSKIRSFSVCADAVAEITASRSGVLLYALTWASPR